MNNSPKRGTFGIETLLNKVQSGKKTLDEVEDLLKFYRKENESRRERESKPEWKVDNLEYDLRNTAWICNKAKEDNSYAQNLYAALCNNDFIKNEVWPILSEKRWHCSWRYAGGIVADMIERGDYIDWYCSGIRDIDEKNNSYVRESTVTSEIREDLLKLGWLVAEDAD